MNKRTRTCINLLFAALATLQTSPSSAAETEPKPFVAGQRILRATDGRRAARVELLLAPSPLTCAASGTAWHEILKPRLSVVEMHVFVDDHELSIPGACAICGLYDIVYAAVSSSNGNWTLQFWGGDAGGGYREEMVFDASHISTRRVFLAGTLAEETKFFPVVID